MEGKKEQPKDKSMESTRAFGILLHPTSIPSRFGIGVMGKQARAFVEWLQKAGAAYWQVLPLGATGYGECPYLGVSAWSGNPYLIDPEALADLGWLTLEPPPAFASDRVEYQEVISWKWTQLKLAFAGFSANASSENRQSLQHFRERESRWLPDYALFMALTDQFQRTPWNHWPLPLRKREPQALRAAQEQLKQAIDFHAWTQWIFFMQWEELRRHARERGIRIIGDIPIFMSHNSAEVWAHPEYFYLDEFGHPTVVGGVPPDYFSATGQRWGNPLYRWEVLEQRGFDWWIDRIRTVLRTCDIIRLDHFRGFESYWEIPASEPTAVRGQWVKGPGDKFFSALHRQLGSVSIIAEDLGIITDEVRALRDRFGFPGMKVLQFGFNGDENNDFLPHRLAADGHYVVYTGTHDNDTSLGWYRSLPEDLRGFVKKHASRVGVPVNHEAEVPWAMMQLALGSPGHLAMIPLQDVLELGSEARMNQPAEVFGNWAWRYQGQVLTEALASRLRSLAAATGRVMSWDE